MELYQKYFRSSNLQQLLLLLLLLLLLIYSKSNSAVWQPDKMVAKCQPKTSHNTKNKEFFLNYLKIIF